MQNKLRAKYGKTILYFADELYLNAGLDFPNTICYDDFPQFDNGVGMVRDLWNSFRRISQQLPGKASGIRRILLITGASGPRVLRPVLNRLRRIEGLCCEILPVPNLLFGKSVTVSGLLGGKDILAALSEKNGRYDLLALPENLLNRDAKFIDDLSLKDFRRSVRPARVSVGLQQLVESL
jgi:NifB/MoaA-like Fe-S oxidoreductase